jgi:hypothetical protein
MKGLLVTLALMAGSDVLAANSWKNNLTITGIYNVPNQILRINP